MKLEVGYTEEHKINGNEYLFRVLTVQDRDYVDEIIKRLSKLGSVPASKRNIVHLVRGVKRKNGQGEWEGINDNYFNTIPLVEYTTMVQLLTKINTFSDVDYSSEDFQFLLWVMEHYHQLDFSLLNNLTLPQKDALKKQWEADRKSKTQVS